MTCECGAKVAECCEPILAGAPAPTAERLMRSRFTAFRRADMAYVGRSWHPDTRPDDLESDPDVQWRRLQIVATAQGGAADTTGVVEFRASYRSPDGGGLLHERSRFVRHDGRWVYLDGQILDT